MHNDYFRRNSKVSLGSAKLHTVFDAELSTPELIDEVARTMPEIREALATLRESLPLVPHSGIGTHGQFHRFPNHYRSVSFMVPSSSDAEGSGRGAIVFKGTEPLLPDFSSYLEWMLSVTFRGGSMPMGLHFPLDMRMPPGAMWIEESKAEQAVTSKIQRQYLQRHGKLARLPVPLFVGKLTQRHTEIYEEVVRSYIPDEVVGKIISKISDGLGIEVYYYPELPVRVVDLFSRDLPGAFKQSLSPTKIEDVISKWTSLFSEMLCLEYMPFAAWQHQLGSCCDSGNACIDGGFNDLLTLVPFGAIPSNGIFRSCMASSIRALSESAILFAQLAMGLQPRPDPEAQSLLEGCIKWRIQECINSSESAGYRIDEMLKNYVRSSSISEVFQVLRNNNDVKMRHTQYSGTPTALSSLIERTRSTK